MSGFVGEVLRLSLFGESHGPLVGAVLEGLAPGIAVDETLVAAEMDKRRATGAISTARQEADRVEFVAGLYEGRTTGTPLALVIRNADVKSADYAELANLPRPGHADLAAHAKYLGFADPRGGGHFSGRLTAPLVAAGAVCRQILAGQGIVVGTHLARCAGVDDDPLPQEEPALAKALEALNQKAFAVQNEAAGAAMQRAIVAAKEAGDSVGGILESAACGLPAGVGEPFFGSVESVLAALLYGIPAVKGVAFGLGFGFAELRGSAANDAIALASGRLVTETNLNGGINGGITNGMPLVVRCAVKPTPSIATPQRTVHLAKREAATLELKGRHDPSIVHRARAVADAVLCIGLVDLCCRRFGPLWQRGKAAENPGEQA